MIWLEKRPTDMKLLIANFFVCSLICVVCVGGCVSQEVKDPGVAQEEKILSQDITPGQPAPVWKLPRLDGGTASLDSFRGKYVVQAFWATWCVPARSTIEGMMSLLHSVYGDNNGVKIVSIGISVWTDLESMEKERVSTRKSGFRWTQVYDDTGHVSRQYQIRCIPTVTLIDPEGNIVIQGEVWDVLPSIRKVLAEEIKAVKLDDLQQAYLEMGEGYAVAGDEYFTNQAKVNAAIDRTSDFIGRFSKRATEQQMMMARQFLAVLLSCSGQASAALDICDTALENKGLSREHRIRLLYARTHALGHLDDPDYYLACVKELKGLDRFFAGRVGWELWRIYDANVAVAYRRIPEAEEPAEAWEELEKQYLLITDIFPAWCGAHYHLAHFYQRRASVQTDQDLCDLFREAAEESLSEGIRLSWKNIWELPRQIPPDMILLEEDMGAALQVDP